MDKSEGCQSADYSLKTVCSWWQQWLCIHVGLVPAMLSYGGMEDALKHNL